MKSCKKILLPAILLFFISPIIAQKIATVKGSVKSASSKAPLIEAVITLSSPALEGSKIALTDSTGNYKITGLPPGVYSITFEMEGFKTSGKSEIEITDGAVVGVSIEMARARDGAKTKTKERIILVSNKNGSR